MYKIKDYMSKYLENINMNDYDYKTEVINCEVCDSSDIEVIQEIIDIGNNSFGKLPVHGCKNCGYVFHKERFEKKFYRDFYEKNYRTILFGNTKPEKLFIKDQVYRGKKLYENLEKYIPSKGNLLDVGCSSGGLMRAFKENGWNVKGNDPDIGYVNFGKEVLKLDIDCVYAEDMDIKDGSIDLIIITGSLEHVYDLKTVLEKCRKASSKDAIIVIEGRALGFCLNQGFFTHTHRRYLDKDSISLVLQKYGWEPILVTQELLSGPTRPGGVFCIAKVSELNTTNIKAKISKEDIRKKHELIKKKSSFFEDEKLA